MKTVHQNQQSLQRIESKIDQHGKEINSLQSVVKELKELQEKNDVQSFSLKAAGYEV